MVPRALRRAGRALQRRVHTNGVTRRVGIDPRTLAAFRIALGAVLLVDLWLRWGDLVAFYTDDGVFPRDALAAEFPTFAWLSIHAVSGDAWVQALLFVVAAVFALALLVGYHTTLATAGSWVLLASLQARNPLVLNGGDTMLALTLLLAIFLPLGDRWSIDAQAVEPDRRPIRPVFTLASTAILLQVVVIYLTNAVLKLRGDRWLAGDAIEYAFELEQFTVPMGDLVAGQTALLTAATWAWLGLLLASPLLLLSTGRLRIALVGAFVGAHAGMGLTMRLGVFPLISITLLLPFLPGTVWKPVGLSRLGRKLERIDGPEIERGGVDARGVRRRCQPLASVIVVAVVAVLFAWNAAALGLVDAPDGAGVDPEEQRWDMFAPDPPGTDVTYVAPATLDSGVEVDAFRPEAERVDRPPDDGAYPTARWRKFLVSQWATDGPDADHLAEYLCWRAGDRHGDVERVAVEYVERDVQPGGTPSDETTRSGLLVERSCDG